MGGLGGLRSSEWGNWYGRMKGRVVDVRMQRDMNIKNTEERARAGSGFPEGVRGGDEARQGREALEGSEEDGG